MLRFIPLLLLLIVAPTFGMDMASMDAIINSCQKGQMCSCPRAKIARIDKSACGPGPEWILDDKNNLAIDQHDNAKRFDKYNKCLDDLFNTNSKIDRYNSIFDRCQNPRASDEKTKFTNLPPRPIYSGEGKTLNEQVEDVKAEQHAQEQALREEEAAGQAEEARAYAAARPPVATQPPAVQPQQQAGVVSMNGKHIIECKPYHQHIMCLCEEPTNGIYSGLNNQDDNMGDRVNGQIADITGNRGLYERMQ